MTEYVIPIQVLIKLQPEHRGLDTKELIFLLQDIADEWYSSKIPTIPCGYVPKTVRG